MAKKSAAKSTNLLACKWGKARFYKHPKARSRWADPAIAEYDPNWWVRFHCGGETWLQSAGPLYPTCDGLAAVKVWAETVMKSRVEAMRAGLLEELEAVTRPPKALFLSEVLEVLSANLPRENRADYVAYGQCLERIWTEVTGKSAEAIEVTPKLWTKEKLNLWVRMRQEHFIRGWSVRGAEPVDAWAQLRAAKLPGIDHSRVMQCNTTILSMLRKAKAVFARDGERLPGLVLPPLGEFLRYQPKIAAVKGHRAFPAAVMARIVRNLPRVRRAAPKVWAFVQLMAWAANRPVQVRRMTAADLVGNVLHVPAAKQGESSRVVIGDPEVVGVLRSLASESSLLGARSEHESEEIYRRMNRWLRRCGVEGTLVSYLFRHMRLQHARVIGGKAAVAELGGHTTEQMAGRYTAPTNIIEMPSPWAVAAAG